MSMTESAAPDSRVPEPTPGDPRLVRSGSYWRISAARLRANRMGMASLIVLVLLTLLAICAPLVETFVSHRDPNEQDLINLFAGPGADHWLGTDNLGRDTLTRLVYGARVTLGVAFLTVVFALTMGVVVGLCAGYFRGWVDEVLMRVVDAVLALPALFLYMLMAIIFRPGPVVLALIIASVSWCATARLVRAETLALSTQRIRARRPVRRRHRLAHPAAPHPPARATDDHRRRQHQRRVRDPHRGRARLPRPRHPAAHAKLGEHAHQRAVLPVPVAAARHPARRSDPADRGGAQPPRQRPARRARPADLATVSAILEVDGLRVEFPTRRGIVKAVDGVSFSLARGETLGIVGESGCGKSVTALSLMGLIQPPGRIVGGAIRFKGRDLLTLPPKAMQEVRGAEIAMIFQDPMTSLNPVYRTGWQVGEPLRLHRDMKQDASVVEAVELLRSVGIPDAPRRVAQYPHEFSGGMRQRAMIAMGSSVNPDVILADEPTTALDVTTQAQILDLLRQNSADHGTSMILITHNFGVVAGICDRLSRHVRRSGGRGGPHRGGVRQPAAPVHLVPAACVAPPGRREPASPGRDRGLAAGSGRPSGRLHVPAALPVPDRQVRHRRSPSSSRSATATSGAAG